MTSDLPYGERIHLVMPKGLVAETAIDKIVHSVRLSLTDKEIPMTESYDLLYDNVEWTWRTTRGTLPKRIAALVYNTYKVRLSSRVLQDIGNIASTNSVKQSDYYFDFDNCISWRDGDFSDRGSCMITNTTSKKIFRISKICAIRFFASQRGYAGIGRMLFQYDEAKGIFILFNAYGLSPHDVARVFAVWQGASYRVATVGKKGGSSSYVYLNTNKLVVGMPEDLAKHKSYQINCMPSSGVPMWVCSYCLQDFPESHTRHGSESNVCLDCFNKREKNK